MTQQEVAKFLGVSGSMVYKLAAPNGPIPCTRVGRRVIFDLSDVERYKAQCQFTETKSAARSSLSSTRLSMGNESALLKAFRELGIKPKLTPTTARPQPNFTQGQQA